MSSEEADDPWAAAPDWVHLPDVPQWISRRFGCPTEDARVIQELISAIRHNQLIYRIFGLKPDHGGRRPPGFGTASDRHLRDSIVTDWDLAETDWKAGTVGGWRGPDGVRARHRIEVWWRRLEYWFQDSSLGFSISRQGRSSSPGAAPEQPAACIAIYHTGTAGRPTSGHLVDGEFKRRATRGEAHLELASEAHALRTWLAEQHQEAPPMTEKTIKNRIRKAHRAYREVQNPRPK